MRNDERGLGLIVLLVPLYGKGVGLFEWLRNTSGYWYLKGKHEPEREDHLLAALCHGGARRGWLPQLLIMAVCIIIPIQGFFLLFCFVN
jgi:hypothetical protein